MTTLIAIDGGKSGLRIRVDAPDGRQVADGSGFTYRDPDDDLMAIVDGIRAATAGLRLPPAPDAICVGLTGVPGPRPLRSKLSQHIAQVLNGPVILGADVVLAHAGALTGPGVVISAGTGTNVLAVSSAGDHARIDGWGPVIGDRGSGFAVGRAGLQAAAAALDGVGPSTTLTVQMDAFLGGLDLNALQDLYRDRAIVARVASFAQDVLHAADGGDTVARRVCDEAATDLATSAARAADRAALPPSERSVSHSGRLLQPGGYLANRLDGRLTALDLTPVSAKGDALDGGIRIAADPGCYTQLLDLPDEVRP